ncbi:hypothetical protein [Arthrobacter sp. ISL-5]|nr:hypothetical protein [Arthrobacter sp. ISL-5]
MCAAAKHHPAGHNQCDGGFSITDGDDSDVGLRIADSHGDG